MNIKYEFAPEDAVAFQFAHKAIRSSVLSKAINFLLKVLMAIMAAFSLFVGVTSNSLLSIGLGVLLVLLLLYESKPVVSRRLLKHSPYTTEAGLFCLHEISIDSEELVERTEVNEYHDKWSSIFEIVERPDYIFIYRARNAAYIIPRNRVIEGNYDEFVSEVKRLYKSANLKKEKVS
jgi:hypothetical protein